VVGPEHFLYCPYFLTFFSMLCLYNRFKRLKIIPFYSVHLFNLLLPITLPGELKRPNVFYQQSVIWIIFFVPCSNILTISPDIIPCTYASPRTRKQFPSGRSTNGISQLGTIATKSPALVAAGASPMYPSLVVNEPSPRQYLHRPQRCITQNSSITRMLCSNT
jgi:hypothetical protein